jgi:hypothetical protein
MNRADLLDYDNIKVLAADLARPVSSLIAMSGSNDPFAITPGRRAGAEWFARIWKRLGMGNGAHLRRVHYAIVSQKKRVLKLDDTPYENTDADWQALNTASRDARYLDLVPAEHFVDRRNAEPLIRLSNESSPAFLSTIYEQPKIETATVSMPGLPRLFLSPPQILQPYHVELWCEKTTVNDVLEPLAGQYGLNVITGQGELSETACINVVERAQESGRPVRILYISDFDPAGVSMPVAVARKIEHRLYLKDLDLDIQLRPIALTTAQCEEYELPRITIKESEHRANAFEERHGIIETEIERYWDADLDDLIQEMAVEVESTIAEIHEEVHGQHRTEIKALETAWKQIEKERARQIAAWEKRARPVWRAIVQELSKQAPDEDAIDWPEPAEGDEDDDPLFDSSREYLEQVTRYKEHQGKPDGRVLLDMKCEICGKAFLAQRSTARVCSVKCRKQLRYQPGGERAR